MKDSEVLEYDFIKPSHYVLWEGMDSFDVHRKILTKEEYIGFLKGNILKYQMRLGKKPGESVEKDMKKIKTYEKELKEQLK